MNIFGDTTSFSGNCFASIGDIIFEGRNNNDATPHNILLQSTINRKSWTDISAPYEKIAGASSIYALAVYKNNLIAGSWGSGVYVSSDSGTTWTSLNNGWGNYSPIYITSLAISNNYLFAGTDNEGIFWRIPISQVVQVATGIEKSKENLPINYSLQQNYPNPFNPTTTINYQLPSSGFVTLKVYDMLGRLVKTLVDEKKPEGSYSVQFNANNIASGIYFYKLKADNYSAVKKMILLK